MPNLRPCDDLAGRTYIELSLAGRMLAKAHGAIERCATRIRPVYTDYGERGIKVWQPWVDDPYEFAYYLILLPHADDRDRILDRIDNDGHYEPGNLRHATMTESNRNKRSPGKSKYMRNPNWKY